MFSHFNVLVKKCAQFREEGIFTDVQLKVGRTLFPAHRMVLAAHSDYFYAMFSNGMKETNQEVIELRDENMSSETFKQIIDYIYSGYLRINKENVFQVLAAADHLQVTSVLQECCDFLKREVLQCNLDVRWYCHICAIAEKYGLRELREAVESKMALNYHDICESEEFLAHLSADKLFSLLSRDDLSAPSETFVFKSVMQWIKHKRERIAVAAKVIGAVRLGLVDIEVLIHELNTRDFQRLSDIHKILFDAAIYFHVPSQVPRFAEKSKPRAPSQVLVAITPGSPARYFDGVTKCWERLTSMSQPQLAGLQAGYRTAEHVGSHLYVADNFGNFHCYSLDQNLWRELPRYPWLVNNLCAIGDYVYAIGDYNQVPQRYSLSQRRWQPIAKLSDCSDHEGRYYAGATVFNSKLYVIYGCAQLHSHQDNKMLNAMLYSFDPQTNRWDFLSNTCEPHFDSTLFVVNNKLCVAGGYTSVRNNKPCGEEASVEVCEGKYMYWSIVQQNHIPRINMYLDAIDAIEVEGRVYFIINKFPIDSGIRISPGEMYPVHLGEWENLARVDQNDLLCYLPVKRKP